MSDQSHEGYGLPAEVVASYYEAYKADVPGVRLADCCICGATVTFNPRLVVGPDRRLIHHDWHKRRGDLKRGADL